MTERSDPVEDFSALWRTGRPDLDAFVKAAGALTPRQLADVVAVDQRERWQAGERTSVDAYFQRYPLLCSDPDLAVDLVYGEYLLHEEHDDTSVETDLSRRYPEFAATLHAQIELHRALVDPDAPDEGNSLPTQFGRYDIQGELGRGGMGTVYLARDTQLNRLVALKVPRLDGDPRSARQFLREARAAAALQHPNICPIYDSGQIDGRHFITMAYLEGESLATRIERAPPTVAEAVLLVRTLANALEEAHRAGIVHRDLKPANILHDKKGQPVITDFGLARSLSTSTGETSSGQGIIGTPAYMAPEQVNGDTTAIGPVTDVYALGVVLYELLTGTRPFDGPLGTLLGKISTQEAKPPSEVHAKIDEQLDAICLRALAKSPRSRFPDMASFAAALDTWQPGAVAQTAQGKRRIPWPIYAVGCAICVLIASILIWQPWKTDAIGKVGKSTPTLPVAETTRDQAAAQKIADRAWVLNDNDDTDRAIAECDRALQLDDQCVTALMCRANAQIKKRRFDPAIADLNRAANLEPKNEMPHVDLAWAKNEIGEYDQAIAHANQALEIKSDSAEAFNQRGWSHFNKRKYREAVDDFTIAIKHDPNYVSAYQHRSSAYSQLGMTELAEKDIKKADEIEANAKKKGN